MNKEELNQYANWILNECNTPTDEIKWLVSNLPENIKNDIEDNVLKFLNENKQIMKKQERKEAKRELITGFVFLWSVWIGYYLVMKIITL